MSGKSRRRGFLWTAAGSVLLAYVALVAILVIYRHPYRLDLTQEEENTLTPETLNRLSLLKEEVRVILPVFFQKENPLHGIQSRVILKARALLKEYMIRQPLLRMEAELDLRIPDLAERWKELCARHGLSDRRINCFIFINADGSLRQVVGPDDLALYDKPTGRESTSPQIREFRAQAAFTAALTRLIERERKRVYALEDHRESSTSDQRSTGLSVFKKDLEAGGYEVKPLQLAAQLRVPSDCALLLIAAPAAPFRPEDREKIAEYLRGGGRLLAALGPVETGLEDLLDSWNVRARKGNVLRLHELVPGMATYVYEFLVKELAPAHPLTDPLKGGPFAAVFTHLRALEFRNGNGLQGEHLLRTSDERIPFLDLNGNHLPDKEEEKGQVAVAGAVWRPRPDRPPPDYRHVDTRLVVLGAATPLTNEWYLQFSNRDLIQNAVSWLLGREERITTGSSAWTERRLKWDARIERFLFWVPILLFPGIVVCFGGFVYFLRRS